MLNTDFMAYMVLTGDMGFEATRTMGLLEAGCAVMTVTPESYDYCGSAFEPPAKAAGMNTLA